MGPECLLYWALTPILPSNPAAKSLFTQFRLWSAGVSEVGPTFLARKTRLPNRDFVPREKGKEGAARPPQYVI